MKYIGNVVTNTKFTINNRFNFVESYDDIIVGLPTLIIGYKETKALVSDFKISKHKISDELFWTFKKNEKKDKFNQIVIEFVEYCFNLIVKDINYVYIDPIHFSSKKLKKISQKILELNNPVGVIVDDRVIYIYGDNIIFSFDTEICELTGIKKESLIKKYNKITNGFLDFDKIFIEYGNDITALNDSIRYLPFLYSMDNG